MTPRAVAPRQHTPSQNGFVVTPQTMIMVAGLMVPMAGVIGSYFSAQARMDNLAATLESVIKRQEMADARQSAADDRLQGRVERIDRNVSWLCQMRARDEQESGRSDRMVLTCGAAASP